jgi:hypothetical protein
LLSPAKPRETQNQASNHSNAFSPGVDNASQWLKLYTARTHEWAVGKRTREQARQLAWGDLQNEWHAMHGRRWPTWQCAGCEAPIGGVKSRDLPDGNRVHFEPMDCLIIFGDRWRSTAHAALIKLGLEPPSDFQ